MPPDVRGAATHPRSSRSEELPLPPRAGARTGLTALQDLAGGGILAALGTLHGKLGDIFRIMLPGFNPIVMAGPSAARFVLVEHRSSFNWRSPHDPVTRLLRQGLLVQDGLSHDEIRNQLNPSFHGSRFVDYAPAILDSLEREASSWRDGPLDVLPAMRRVTLTALMRTLFNYDPQQELDGILPAVLKLLDYISPGLWIFEPRLPRTGYRGEIETVDRWLLSIVRERRDSGAIGQSMLDRLIRVGGLSDAVIRDQLLTMLIAGHDTNTSALAWAMLLLAEQPDVEDQLSQEIRRELAGSLPDVTALNRLAYLDAIVKETLRLFPPIHVANRIAREDLNFEGHRIPAGTRVMLSIYLTHRHPAHWSEPQQFDPTRFLENPNPGRSYAYIPFGGGPRNCIGAGFGLLETKLILARLSQLFHLTPAGPRPGLRMRATLEPTTPALVIVERRAAGDGR